MNLRYSIVAAISLSCSVLQAQDSKKELERKVLDSIQAIDWLHYDYKQLDKDHKIITSSEDFDQWKKQYRFKPNQELSYQDSLSVVLSEELQNAQAVRIATLRLGYTWDRASWSLLLPSQTVKAMAYENNIKYPYQFISEIRENSEKNDFILKMIDELKLRLQKLELKESLEGLDVKELMRLAFQYSPERLKVVDSILASQGSSRRQD